MTKNYMQLDQLANDDTYSEIAPEPLTELQHILSNINSRLTDLGSLAIDGLILSIGTSLLNIGPDNKKRSFAPLNGSSLNGISGSISLVDGITTTGSFVPTTLPDIPANYYIRAGVETQDNGQTRIVWGFPADSSGGAGAPAFSDGAIWHGELLLQNNGVAGSGNFIPKTDSSDLKQYTVGGSGGGGGSVSVSAEQTTHGFSVGDPVAFSDDLDMWVPASIGGLLAVGIVSAVPSPDRVVISLCGKIKLTGLTPGTSYFLTGTSVTETALPEEAHQLLYMAVSDNEALLLIEAKRLASFAHQIKRGGMVSYQIGSTLFLEKGTIEFDDGSSAMVGELSGGVLVNVPVNLDALETSPVPDTTYYLYGDLFYNERFNDGREHYLLNSSSLLLNTVDPYKIDHYRFVLLAVVNRTSSDWGVLGNGVTSYGARWDRHGSSSVKGAEVNSKKFTIASTDVFLHTLSGKPQQVEVRYNDGSVEKILDPSAYITDVSDVSISLDLSSYIFAGGDYVEVIAIYTPPISKHFASSQTQYQSKWIDNPSTTELLHGLLNAEAIKGISVIKWDVTLGSYSLLDLSTIVDRWDDEKIYLDWTGATPSPLLKYQIVTGGSPLPSSIATYFSSFSKFVGNGPGFYRSLTDALSESAAGDDIAVFVDELQTTQLEISLSNISITFLRGSVVHYPILVTGNRVRLRDVSFAHGGGSWPHAISIYGEEVECNFRMDISSGSVESLVKVSPSSRFSTVRGIVVNTGGLVLEATNDLGVGSDIIVRGA